MNKIFTLRGAGLCVLTAGLFFLAGCGDSSDSSTSSGTLTSESNSATVASNAYYQSGGTETRANQAYSASNTDESAVLVMNSGVFNLSDSTITSTGNSSSSDSSSFTGLNAGILANGKSTINITGCNITTSGNGANDVFAYGEGSSISIYDSIIKATGKYAHGVMTSGGGLLNVSGVDISTSGANSAAIATDRGSGTINFTGGNVITSGTDSPGIYSTGAISVSDSTIKATGAEAAVIEGFNSISLINTSLAGGKNWGVLIYQSMSGDAETGTGRFTMTGGSLSASSGPLFFITNTMAEIKLSGVNITASSGTILKASGTDRWGVSGSNGGIVTITANSQTLKGDLVSDSISSINAKFLNGSSLTGSIKSAALTLDPSSSLNVTADSYLVSLTETGGVTAASLSNINSNGFKIYYDTNVAENSWLGGANYPLNGGGQLVPTTGIAPSITTSSGSSSASQPSLPPGNSGTTPPPDLPANSSGIPPALPQNANTSTSG